MGFEPTETGVRVQVRQTQDQPAYSMRVEVRVNLQEGGTAGFPMELSGRQSVEEFALEGTPTWVDLGPKDRLPATVRFTSEFADED